MKLKKGIWNRILFLVFPVAFDKWVKRIAIIIFLFFIVGSLVKLDTKTTEYRNVGYRIQQGYHMNDSIPSSFMLYVEDTSKILQHDNSFFTGGSWFLYVGHPADTNDFFIEVKECEYITGTRTYVKFIYKNKPLEMKNTKFQSFKEKRYDVRISKENCELQQNRKNTKID